MNELAPFHNVDSILQGFHSREHSRLPWPMGLLGVSGIDSPRQIMYARNAQRGGVWRVAHRSSVECFQDIPFSESVAVKVIHYALPIFMAQYGLLSRWIKINWEIPLIAGPNFDPKTLFAYGDFNAQGGCVRCLSGFARLPTDNDQRQYRDNQGQPFGPFEGCVPLWRVAVGFSCFVFAGIWLFVNRDRSVGLCVAGFGTLLFVGVGIWGTGHYRCNEAECEHCDIDPHNHTIVLQKYLTNNYFCSTVIDMANVLPRDKQIAIIGALAEGSSIRSIERITGVHRDTIMRLGVRIGQNCGLLLDSKMQDLGCNYLQFDEVWGFIGKKERHVGIDDDPEMGDVWTYCAIDSETKLVPAFKCGKRTLETTTEFVQDVASRMRHRVQVSSDAMHSYIEAMERAFGADVDYGQCVKVYAHDDAQHPERKYSAPRFANAYRRSVTGMPEMEFVSTSHVERLNATTRLHVKRLSRLTLAFSKKLENFKAALALHFAYYNFVRRHNALRCTPAMAAGIERDFWTVGDLVEATS